jgi:hypothetical protein
MEASAARCAADTDAPGAATFRNGLSVRKLPEWSLHDALRSAYAAGGGAWGGTRSRWR